jgi:hypothetical protein
MIGTDWSAGGYSYPIGRGLMLTLIRVSTNRTITENRSKYLMHCLENVPFVLPSLLECFIFQYYAFPNLCVRPGGTHFLCIFSETSTSPWFKDGCHPSRVLRNIVHLWTISPREAFVHLSLVLILQQHRELSLPELLFSFNLSCTFVLMTVTLRLHVIC